MTNPGAKEAKFLAALKNIFIGAPVEGESGYINLMRVKARYFEEGVFPRLMADIKADTTPFPAAFREELFDKLHSFFHRYFSESGSIYFRHTPLHYDGLTVRVHCYLYTAKNQLPPPGYERHWLDTPEAAVRRALGVAT